MQTEVLVALIAAGGALVAAAVSATASAKTKKAQSELAQAIEALKKSMAREEAARAVADRELGAVLDGLKQCIAAIQNVKDQLQVVLAAVPSSLDGGTAHKMLETSRDSFNGVFGNENAHFNKDEDRAAHQAKNLALKIDVELRQSLASGDDVATCLPERSRTILAEYRAQLTEYQQVLRDSRSDRISARTFYFVGGDH